MLKKLDIETFEFDGNTLVGVKGKIGTKKSDVK